ncbi:TonB-dependent receptor plug domain-containing protein [Marinifilum sp. N1E240]|uniref:TonB-dependent receptor n=1 Tax=Marinifilum sp. N1E240 TaxID=2608082 RepID=UPI00128E9205|nr:TonB-dependent receptor [Marinifilum sp. N1E240]MPQ45940.1 TonB-dependent receptor plug domain-containing protein [Marinifilum sp. N1E240]
MRKILITLLIVSFHLTVIGQSITLQKDSISFHEIISKIEKSSTYKFYYISNWVEDQNFNPNFKNTDVKKIINWLGKKSNLNYQIIKETKVVFTKNYRIKTNYAQAYNNYLSKNKIKEIDTIFYKSPIIKKQINNKIGNEYKLFTIGDRAHNPNKTKVTFGGKITDVESGESLIGTVIYIKDIQKGTVTNQYGQYSISIPIGKYKVEYRSVGMKTTFRNIVIHSNGKLNVEMKNKPTSLKEVVVTAKTEDPVRNLRMGMEKITVKALKQLPLGMGEADIIKSTLLLPGVQSVGEASSGFNVRGGNTDQNLVLLNQAPINNTSHFFGFFSGFNSDIIKDITLYKSGIPAKYGGRVSSVMDLSLKDGNRKKYSVNGGISPVSGRLTIEGPLKKDKGSFILAGRTTYSDWVLKLLDDKKLQKSSANFYDFQGNFSWDLDEKNSLYLSGYYSHDKFDYYQEDKFEYNTIASTIKWKHIFSPKLFSTFSAAISKYDYTTESRQEQSQSYSVKYKFDQYIFNADFSYLSSLNHKIDFGINSTYYDLAPGDQKPSNPESLINAKKLEGEQALEMAAYISDEFELSHFMSLSVGLRYSFYGNLGPKTEYNYIKGQPRNLESMDGSTYHKSGFISTYSEPEIRISTNVRLGSNSSLKASYNGMSQYVQMISNTASMTPTDIWKLSDKYLKPQKSHQYSIGLYRKINQNKFEASIETYYKKLDNVLDYKGGAKLVMNEHLETDVLNGKGKAYGLELMFQKKRGKLTGWVNYTYSKILHKIDSEFDEEKVNDGDYFPANYDKPHDFKFVANYKLGRRMNVSTNFSYSTGRPFTAPVAYYNFAGTDKVHYSDRNSMRMPDYVRLDIAATINGNLKAKKLNHSSWTIAVYNVLGRQNAYNIFFRTEGEKVNGYKMSIFGKPIVTVTYNFKLFGNAKDDF